MSLDKAATALAESLSGARVWEAEKVIPQGKVAEVKAAFEQAQTQWHAALTSARGRFKPILRRQSHITVVLRERGA